MDDKPVVVPETIILPATRPQLRVLLDQSRFIYCFASRRFGKTTLGVMKLLKEMRRPVKRAQGQVWWVSPTYAQGAEPYRLFLDAARRAGLYDPKTSRKDERLVGLKTGFSCRWKSADQPDNLRGSGLAGLVVDEFSQVPDAAWHECLRPTLSDLNGWFLGIGTPKGARGWGYAGYRRGQDPAEIERGTSSYKFTIYDALFIPPQEVEAARREMPERAFQQEFMAAFLDGVGTVFVDLRQRPRLAPIPGEGVGIGIDWAKKVDRTWFVAVGQKSGAILEAKRFDRLPYPRQVELAVGFYEKWRAKAPYAYVVHDQTGVGEALNDLLDATPIGRARACEGLIFTEPEKRNLVEEAVVDFESSRLGFIQGGEIDPLYEELIREHEDYSLSVGKTGKVSYGAPEGLHDDAVMATCLANRARRAVRGKPLTPGLAWI